MPASRMDRSVHIRADPCPIAVICSKGSPHAAIQKSMLDSGDRCFLQFIPAKYPDRPRYEKLCKEMAEMIVAIQPKDGLWRPSLLDPGSDPEPETSRA